MTMKKQPILTLNEIKEIAKKHTTPFVVYDEKAIKENIKNFYEDFEWVGNFKNYFAVKACPNPSIIKILKNLWSWVDCSSLWELVMSELLWFKWDEIMFTSNDTSAEEFKKANELWAIVNFDDITHISFYENQVWNMPNIACCRFNPWELKKGNAIIWNPTKAKYWMTKEQIIKAYKTLKDKWVKRFGLHTMVASNELDPDYFVETAKILFELVKELEEKIWIHFEFVNLWGGIWIPYNPKDKAVNLEKVSDWIKKEYEKIIWKDRKLRIIMECGRMITWPYGQLVTKVQHITKKYKDYVWVDASMQCLMRPAMYWAYHYIDVFWKENQEENKVYDVTWSLCENNDKFAIDRKLPKVEIWDYLVIYDAWAHGTAMWFNYNAKLRPEEILKTTDWQIKSIRRAETLKDYFNTINWISWFKYE